jgi:spermidine synthase
MNKFKTYTPFLALGMLSIGAQTLIVREFMASFGGNELLIGLFYFFWLSWTGIGAIIARHVKSGVDPLWEALIYPLIVFAELLLFIFARSLIVSESWELVTAPRLLPVLALATALVSIKTGTLFVRLAERFHKDESDTAMIDNAYIGECIGSFLGGSLLTLGVWKLPDPLVILSILVILYLALLWPFPAQTAPRLRKPGLAIMVIFFITISILHTPLNHSLQRLRGHALSAETLLLDTVYTPYRHLNFYKSQNRMIVSADGAITAGYPETASTDRDIALLTAAALPKRVLLIGIGVENLIARFLNYPIESIVWIQPDWRYLETFIEHCPPPLAAAFLNNRVYIVIQSPRKFLTRTDEYFDLIVSAAGSPSTLASNSFYTREFIDICRKRLTSRGVLAAPLEQEENFLSNILSWYGSSFYHSLSSVFPHVSIVPGKTHWFLASRDPDTVKLDADHFKRRFLSFSPHNTLFPADGFYSILDSRRIDRLRNHYANPPEPISTTLINTDHKPVTFLINNLAFLSLSGFPAAKLFAPIADIITQLLIAILLLFLLLRIVYAKRRRVPHDEFTIKAFQFLSGFSAMSMYLILLFKYQNSHGTMALTLGLWSGLYMSGLAMGSFLVRRLPQRHRNPSAVLVLQIILAIIIMAVKSGAHLTFGVLFLGAGVIGGMSYPVAASAFRTVSFRNLSSILTMLDHWGAALGGLLCSLLLLPLCGIDATLGLLALSAAGLLLLHLPPGTGTRQLRLNHQLDSAPAFILIGLALTALLFNYVYQARLKVLTHPGNNHENTIVINSKDIQGIEGYGGDFTLNISLDEAGKIETVDLSRHRETEAYIKGRLRQFLDRFTGHPFDPSFNPDNIDAITGATVTSRAILKAVDAAAEKTPNGMYMPEHRPLNPTILSFLLLTAIAFVTYRRMQTRRTARLIVLATTVVIAGLYQNLTFSIVHLEQLLTASIPARSLFFSISVIILTVISGRFYCGWLCPLGALQELAGSTQLRRNIDGGLEDRLRVIKYLLLLTVITAIILQAASRFGSEPLTIAFANLPLLTTGKILIILITGVSIFFPRLWCRIFCPVGAFLGIISHFFQPERLKTPKHCIQCPCNVTDFRDPECLQCNICMNKPGQPRPPVSRTSAVLAIVILIIATFLIPVLTPDKSKHSVVPDALPSTTGIKASLENIMELINSGRLSGHECLFYDK